jgi:trans-aconitate 2-methyltransferase
VPRDWNAGSYERVSAPMEAMGRDVLDRLELRGDERVLDAGCGTGRVTAALVERLPRGKVVAVDGSPAMVLQAQTRLGPGVDVRVAELTELELETPVDAILSTATFHWIADHDRLFSRLYATLRPGGRLVAQCGGEGNVAALEAAIARVAEPGLAGWAGPWNFASPAATEQRLAAAGFADVWTWRQTVRVEPEDPHEYFATVMLGSHLERLAPERRDPFVEAVLRNVTEGELAERARVSPGNVAEGEFAERTRLAGETQIRPAANYVRLNILARRPT